MHVHVYKTVPPDAEAQLLNILPNVLTHIHPFLNFILFPFSLSDAKTIIIQLEQECTRMHRDIRLAHEKINKQNMDLEESRDREVASHERLSRAVSTAEKAIAEREAFAKIVSMPRQLYICIVCMYVTLPGNDLGIVIISL